MITGREGEGRGSGGVWRGGREGWLISIHPSLSCRSVCVWRGREICPSDNQKLNEPSSPPPRPIQGAKSLPLRPSVRPSVLMEHVHYMRSQSVSECACKKLGAAFLNERAEPAPAKVPSPFRSKLRLREDFFCRSWACKHERAFYYYY